MHATYQSYIILLDLIAFLVKSTNYEARIYAAFCILSLLLLSSIYSPQHPVLKETHQLNQLRGKGNKSYG
jgi:hypothetical protein